jgi:hypothetical protein
MNNIANILFVVSFFVSAVYLPWWATTAFAIFLLAVWSAYASVFAGGLLMDTVFGIPMSASFGVPYVYTLVFFVLIAVTFALNRTMLE